MDSLVKSRKACKGWVTRASNALLDLLGQQNISITELEHAIKEYDLRTTKLDEVQQEVEAELPEEELDDDGDEAFNFRKR